ncbi:uncharacterized protein METZ01_LOCUS197738 [marine metagenome]|jgi:23S rRNA pseudouridine2605 synthase|uniref:RNA-binding S4 domain-containing protein n=1 Tax=marine metagenome TaxID=408172 RepID=A0A382E433_9ZZZZ|nr:hypothetical protein [Rhodobiaceae bacterium]|tara:strand:+ start:3501 stop:4247 length:747 start_codon:yes stop_codon:yes gene_type:complete
MIKKNEKNKQRIAKFLASSGVASRRESEKIILDKRVEVNGRIISSPAFDIKDGDQVNVDGKPIKRSDNLRVFLFNKPQGYLVTTKDPVGRKTIYDLFPKKLKKIITVGRLDYNSEGLIILTNNGDFSRFLELPSNQFLRTYKVRVHGNIDKEKLSNLSNGITLKGIKYKSIEASLEKTNKSNAWLLMKLKEGKNKEIRRICESFDLKVNRLIRISYGPFNLGKINKTEIIEVSYGFLRRKFEKTFFSH